MARGTVSASMIDRALRRTLPFRFELGAMDPPETAALNPYNHLDERNVSAPWMQKLAERAAERSVVLLKNIATIATIGGDIDGASSRAAGASTSTTSATMVLPLAVSSLSGKTVCVVGPNANSTSAQMGGYVNRHPLFVSTPYGALRSRLDRVAAEVRLVVGCNTTACEEISTEVCATSQCM